jgi:hypothetical protein
MAYLDESAFNKRADSCFSARSSCDTMQLDLTCSKASDERCVARCNTPASIIKWE